MTVETESGETPVSATELALRADREDLRFLGREFLTWLLFHAETADGEFGGGVRVGFSERIRFGSIGSEVDDVVLRGGSPGDSLDARFAIAGGLSVREAEIVLVVKERTFEATIASDTLDLKKVQLPVLLTDEEDDAADERLSLLDELDACVRTMFDSFLELRMSSAWAGETVPAMRQWLSDDLQR